MVLCIQQCGILETLHKKRLAWDLMLWLEVFVFGRGTGEMLSGLGEGYCQWVLDFEFCCQMMDSCCTDLATLSLMDEEAPKFLLLVQLL